MNFSLDKEYFKSIMNFAGWNLIGNLAYVVKITRESTFLLIFLRTGYQCGKRY